MFSGLYSRLTSMYSKALVRPYLNLFGYKVDRRFAIVGNARTGSNYLLDGLKSSVSIRMYHEIFADHNRKIGMSFDHVFSSLFQKESKNVKVVGFKVFYNHLTEAEWQKFLMRKDFKIIHLTRANKLRTIVSLDIAFKTGQWTKSNRAARQSSEKRISLDTSTLIHRLETIRDGEAITRERFKDRPMLEVVYETLVANPKESFQSICRFLDVEDVDFSKIRLTRQNPENLKQLILNYNEASVLLENTPFAEYLND